PTASFACLQENGIDVAERVALVTDASACLPESTLTSLDVQMVPITLLVGTDEFRSGVDLDADRLYRALQQVVPVKSAAPSALDYLDAIEKAGDRPAVIITPATEFTRMYRNACLAAELAAVPV